MIYATTPDGAKARPIPSGRALCPSCRSPVIAKCGEIVTWHWAHESRDDCDRFSEGETDWHLGWKTMVQPEFCEVVIQRRETHRADIVGNGGRVIELQHSPISVQAIREREAFYGRMAWLFDAAEFIDRLELVPNERDFFAFRWVHKRKSVTSCTKAIYFDMGQKGILHVLGWDANCIWRTTHKSGDPLLFPSEIDGVGIVISRYEFIRRNLSDVLQRCA